MFVNSDVAQRIRQPAGAVLILIINTTISVPISADPQEDHSEPAVRRENETWTVRVRLVDAESGTPVIGGSI